MKKKRVKIIEETHYIHGQYGGSEYKRLSALCPFCHNTTVIYSDGYFMRDCQHYYGKTPKFFLFKKKLKLYPKKTIIKKIKEKV